MTDFHTQRIATVSRVLHSMDTRSVGMIDKVNYGYRSMSSDQSVPFPIRSCHFDVGPGMLVRSMRVQLHVFIEAVLSGQFI